MLGVMVAKQELKPTPVWSDIEEAVGRIINNTDSERGILREPPPPLLQGDVPYDTHSDDGEELQSAELDRMLSQITSGELETAKLDVFGNVVRPWTIAPSNMPTPRATFERRNGTWRFTISRRTRPNREGEV